MFRVALVQNESEMLRYAWADIRPLLKNFEYRFDPYTAENISDLFINIQRGKYDAIVLATNSCSDINVYNEFVLEKNQVILDDFLKQNKGIFLSFQMSLTTKESTHLFQEDYDINFVNRSEEGTIGNLAVKKETKEHILLNYPHVVSEKQIIKQCLHNQFTRSLYRGYIIPKKQSNYISLIEDIKYEDSRCLLLSLRNDLPGRIVISTIVFDWQNHKELLENTIRYIVEGQPFISIIKKRNTNSIDFGYMIENLRSNKIPHRIYEKDEFDSTKIPFNVHKIFIIDPYWPLDDINAEKIESFRMSLDRGSKLLTFKEIAPGIPVVNHIGGIENVKKITCSVLLWIESQYKNGRWQNSFWAVFDVIELFTCLGKPISHYKDEIISEIKSHDINGSYDEVMGASCALLKVYFWFLGKQSREYKQTLNWILKRIDDISFFERCTAFSTLVELDEIPLNEGSTIKNDIFIHTKDFKDELQIYRACKTLYDFELIDEAKNLALRLKDLQDNYGKWINVSRTGSILYLLMQIQNKCIEPSNIIDNMIYKGVTYIKNNYNGDFYNWNSDIPSTAKALKAIIKFESKITFPIDELISTIRINEKIQKDLQAIEFASNSNNELRKQNNNINRDLLSVKNKNRRTNKIFLITLLILLPLSWISVFFILHFFEFFSADVIKKFFASFKGLLSNSFFISILSFAVLSLYAILRIFNKIPKISDVNKRIEMIRRKLRQNRIEE